LIIIGIAGTVVPTLPGRFVFGGIVLAVDDDFARIQWLLGVFGILTVIAWVVDYFAAIAGAERGSKLVSWRWSAC
jgi:uncharacterized protein YqgC (DUF456 family)